MVFLDPRPKGEEGDGSVSPLAAKPQVCKNAKFSELEPWLRGGGHGGSGGARGSAARGAAIAAGFSAGRAAAPPGGRRRRTSAPRFPLLKLKLVLLCEGGRGGVGGA